MARFARLQFVAVAMLTLGCKEKRELELLTEGEPCRVDGSVYQHLAEVPSKDCNTCQCMNGGILCTLIACPDADAAATEVPDAGTPDGDATNR